VFTVTLNKVEVSEHISKSQSYELTATVDLRNIEFQNAVVMVVDDARHNIDATKALIGEQGVIYLEAPNGEIALEILNHTMPHVILIDLMMPVMDGFELAFRIKKSAKLKKLPLIAFTASVIDNKNNRILESGLFEDVLYKPASRDSILMKISRFVPHTLTRTSAGNDSFSQKMEVNQEIAEKLPDLLNISKTEIFSKYESLNNKLVIFKIEKFCNRLHELSAEYEVPVLKEYSSRIKSDLEVFDLDGVGEQLKLFPELIRKIENLVAKREMVSLK
jgi:CheY-like chemotaxis protein